MWDAPGEQMVATVGRIEASPGATNVIPGNVGFTIDIRAPRDEQRRRAVTDVTSAIEAICARRRVAVDFRPTHEWQTTACTPRLRNQLGRATKG